MSPWYAASSSGTDFLMSLQIVPRLSAVIGLPGDSENQVRLNADHSNLCRFDASIEKDRDNLRLVEANVEELYEPAGELERNFNTQQQ